MPDLVLYDGGCGLCSRLVRFAQARDSAASLRFAPLQDPRAAALLDRHGRRAGDLDTVYAVLEPGAPGERLLWKGRAAIHVVARLGGAWRAVRLLELLPARLLDATYDLVARHRRRVPGPPDSCALPPPHDRAPRAARRLPETRGR
jgi:predicted DCC family thiol-disulfide oxidoreductase YuxK